MTVDNRHSVSVAGVVVNDEGQALLIQRRDNGHWEPPGGVLEHGETVEDGLLREVLEETGLKVEAGALTGVYQNLPRHIIALVFRCRHIGGEPTTSDETAAFRWATTDDVRSLVAEAYAVRVLDAMEPGPAPAVRWHDGTHLIP
jgi:ADP-ribose pyrophosphatase YjhB (NUDIX family)